jgi:hypothetical protein
VGGGAEAEQAEALRVAGEAEGPVADQARAQQRRGLQIGVSVGHGEAEALVGRGVLGVAAVELVAGESGPVAEVLPSREAVSTSTIGVTEPGHPDPVAGRKVLYVLPGLLDDADDLMARDQGVLRVGQLPIYHVQIRAAHTAGADPDQDLPRSHFG